MYNITFKDVERQGDIHIFDMLLISQLLRDINKSFDHREDDNIKDFSKELADLSNPKQSEEEKWDLRNKLCERYGILFHKID